MKLLRTVSLLAAVAAAALGGRGAWGYAEDVDLVNDAHSTFHYNLVRALAAAAGFDADRAEEIAVGSQATDIGVWKGLHLIGTERPNPNFGQQAIGLYYHFARRGPKSATSGNARPDGRDTCSYFENVDPAAGCPMATLNPVLYPQRRSYPGEPGPCQVGAGGKTLPEVDEIELWAVAGRGLPRFGAPVFCLGGAGACQDESSFRPVQGGSLLAFGIYLHALADTYSHEACQKQCAFQGHSVAPPNCSAFWWHWDAEYGSGPESPGATYTRDAALAVWQALVDHPIERTPKWSDDETAAFVSEWVAEDQARLRQDMADEVFRRLTR